MSRNLQYKSRARPVKVAAKKSAKLSAKKTKTPNYSSSDDDYAGVDLVTDEEDDTDVDAVEEQIIIANASEQDDDDDADDDSASTPRPIQEDEEESSWEGFDDESQPVLGGELDFFGQQVEDITNPGFDAAWRATSQVFDDGQEKRVRFANFDSGDEEDDDDSDIGGWPDIFVPQNDLAPDFRRAIEQDDDQASVDSFWDSAPIPVDGNNFDSQGNESSESDSSGYDSDEGETTEEDEIPLGKRVVNTKSVLRRPSTDSSSAEEVARTPVRPLRKPTLGIWRPTPGRPFVVMNAEKRILGVYGNTPRARRHTSEDSRPHTGISAIFASQALTDMSPMLSNSANLMMSATYGQADHFNGNVLGPPEAFFPWTSIDSNGNISQDSLSSYDDDDPEDDMIWNVDDFIQYGDVSSDEELPADDQGETSSTVGDDNISTPRPTTATSEEHHPRLFERPGLVGAFRSNQHRHRVMSRTNATQDSLLFSSAINSTALRGIKEGRISAATATPTTPATPKPKKGPRFVDVSSPAAAQGNKRKFSGETQGHKRSRSMN